MEEKEKPRNRFNLFLGILVTIYGIVATLVSYQSSQLNDDASNMTFVGIMELTKGNDAYAAADNFVTADYDAITQMFLLWERAAWASLLENLKLVRFIFSGMSVLILAVSLFIYWGAASTILPPAVVPLG
ncbi:MAG: hypothetical protein P8046_09600 [Anaerolineales bacterium]